MIASEDMQFQIKTSLQDDVNDYDVVGIFEELHEDYGLVDVYTIPTENFFEIVAKHVTAWG